MSIYNFIVKDHEGNDVSLEQYKGKVLLIVNTASKCGFTPQYAELEQLYRKYGNERFEILAFPCNQFRNQEFNNDEEIQSFCALNYGVSFPVMARIDVNGPSASPLYQYLCKARPGLFGKSIKWNFTKFLVDPNGKVIKRYSPTTSPIKMMNVIDKLIP